MSVGTDEKYANLLSSNLKLFKWTDKHTAVFRCPICGDSKKNKLKRRGHLYEYKDQLMMKCHNCQASMSFNNFLKELDMALYKAYRLEKFKESKQYNWGAKKAPVVDKASILASEMKDNKKISSLIELETIENLPDGHHAKEYIRGRLIPRQYWTKMFYTDNYRKWVNDHVISGKFEKIFDLDERIVIPFYNKDGYEFAYQGRYLGNDPTQTRYITIFPNKEDVLIYGLDRVDLKKPIPLVEGPFDSLFLDNCLAVAGSSLLKMSKFTKLDLIYVFDNQPRNKEICDLFERTIDEGKKVVIFPSSIKEKDINDMVKAGYDVNKLIRDYTYQGLTALLKFNQWRKI